MAPAQQAARHTAQRPVRGTAPRVVSLVPSVTETLVAWSVKPVACTRFCEQPRIATVGGTKNPDIDAIVALAPDLVVMERDENRREDHDQLADAGLTVLDLHVVSLESLATAMSELAAAVGTPADFASRCLPPEPTAGDHRRTHHDTTAFVPIWRRPQMTINADTYAAALLNLLGVRTAFADHPERYPTVADEEVAATAPDLVLVPTEPYPYKPTHLPELARFAPAQLVDGADLFWWGWRTPRAIAGLAATLARSPYPPAPFT